MSFWKFESMILVLAVASNLEPILYSKGYYLVVQIFGLAFILNSKVFALIIPFFSPSLPRLVKDNKC